MDGAETTEEQGGTGKNVAIALAYLACRLALPAKATAAGGEIEGFHSFCYSASPSTTYTAITELVIGGHTYVRRP